MTARPLGAADTLLELAVARDGRPDLRPASDCWSFYSGTNVAGIVLLRDAGSDFGPVILATRPQ